MQAIFTSRSARDPTTTRATRSKIACRAVASAVGLVRESISAAPVWMRRTLFACVFALIATVGYTGFESHGRIAAGVTVANIPVGGLSYGDARIRLEQRAAEFNQQRVTLSYQGTSWQPTLHELGVSLDTNAAWAEIVRLNSPRYLPGKLLRALHLQTGPLLLGTPLKFDEPSLEAYCRDRMNELGLSPVNAQLMVDGESIMVTQDASGFVISVDDLRHDLARQLNGFTSPTISLTAALTPASVRRSIFRRMSQPWMPRWTNHWSSTPIPTNGKYHQSKSRPTSNSINLAIMHAS